MNQIMSLNYFGNVKIVKNPFKNCKNNLEIFLLKNRIELSNLELLRRILVLVEKIDDETIGS